jgi:hypothetical protein
MKLSAFEKIIRKVVREEIDYALRREIQTLKEELSNQPQPIAESKTNNIEAEDFRTKIRAQMPSFNSGNSTLDSLLSETAITPTAEQTFASNDPVNQFINKDWGPVMEAIDKKKNYRP